MTFVGGMITRPLRFSLAALLLLVAGGCSGTQEMFGLGKNAPDEFAVYSRAPLTLPPDYALRPPEPGVVRPQILMPRDFAKAALTGAPAAPSAFPSSSNLDMASPGTIALLQRTGAIDADPGIRTIVNRETTILTEEDRTFTEKLMFWKTPNEYATLVDPAEESRRINENQALGDPVTDGQTPIIERKRRALLEGIFN